MLSTCALRLHWLLHRRRTPRSTREKVADGVALDPVLLVSGMGGSILNAKKKSNRDFELRVWVRIFLANLEFKKYIWSMYNPDTGVHLLLSARVL
jgi:phospholipase A1